jgi:uncharacterized phage-associated protein
MDASTKEFLTRIVDFYTCLRARDLVNLSHAKGGPWDAAWNHQGRVNPGMKINNDLITSYYSKVSPPFTIQ